MKRIFLLLVMLFMNAQAFADHSLINAMAMNPTLRERVDRVMEKNQVICDLEFSNQTVLDPKVEAKYGAGFKQIALCFRDGVDLIATRTKLETGNQFGLNGLDNVAGVLIASYTWKHDYQTSGPQKVISVVYK